MKSFVTLTLALVTLGAGWADDKKAADDQKKLQGKWELVRGERDGEKFPEEFVKGFKLIFTDDKYEAQLADGTGEEGKVKLKPEDKPASVTFTTGGDQVRQAIYKWEKEELHLCVSNPGGDRPKEFNGNDGNLFLVMKKAK